MFPIDVEAPTNVIWWTLLRYYLFGGFAAGTIVVAYMIHAMAKYREGKIKVPRKVHEENGWGNWKGVVLTLLITGSVLGFVEYQTFASVDLIVPPSTHGGDPININVIGRQFQWEFVYPNGGIQIGNLTVPVNQEVILNITSVDVDHSFSIQMLSVAKDALPGQYNILWFNATSTGNFVDAIRCKELCGVGHADMIGDLNVTSLSVYNKFLASIGPQNTSTITSSHASGPATTIAMPQGVGDDKSLDFTPATVTVAEGTTITFVDQDTSAPHDVVWDTVPTGASPADSQQVMTTGNTFSVTLTVPGTYTYHCAFHAGWMKATIIVTG
jgi:cytochrome c oxidase subunit 2